MTKIIRKPRKIPKTDKALRSLYMSANTVKNLPKNAKIRWESNDRKLGKKSRYVFEKTPDGVKGETYKESKRRNPSPEEKRHQVDGKDFYKATSYISPNKRSKTSFSKKGNTQRQVMSTKRKVDGKNEKGKSSFKSDVKVVERGKPYRSKVKNYNKKGKTETWWSSPVHLVKSKQTSRAERTKTHGKDIDKNLYGDWLKDNPEDSLDYKKKK